MHSFSAEWLALREAADAEARSVSLTRAVAERLARADPLQVVDLGAGAGSNFRFASEWLPDRQRWVWVDQDAGLLEAGLGLTSAWALARGWDVRTASNGIVMGREARTCAIDTLALELAPVEDLVEIVRDESLVTASALLDLVSEDWLHGLAALCRRRRAVVLFALTYEGRFECFPPEPDDRVVQELFNRHQQRDKGFGSALGPGAITCTTRHLAAVGYHVECEPSNWVISSESGELQHRLIDGWVEAVLEIEPEQAGLIRRWQERRLTHLAEGRSRLVVRHQDLAAWLPQ